MFSAECFFQTKQQAKSGDVAEFLVALATSLHAQGYRSAAIFLDHNPTHKGKMKTAFYDQLKLPIKVSFHHFPRYTPFANPTEYVIHLIRQKYLHHHDYTLKLEALEKLLSENLMGQSFVAPAQLVNILEHIEKLILSP